jgi:hypothetical protein
VAICIDGNVVCFGGGCFCQTPTGILFAGEAVGCIFCDLRTPGGYGTLCGFVSGGDTYPIDSPPPRYSNVIEKFPFASDTPASDVGDLFIGRAHASGQSSTVSGYTSGGNSNSNADYIDKFSFVSGGNATDVGEISSSRCYSSGQSSLENGYISGGGRNTPASPIHDSIAKFPFAVDASSSDVATFPSGGEGAVGNSSRQNGYVSGGCTGPGPHVQNINKFPFASDTPATNIGSLTYSRKYIAGQNSSTHGYAAGGSGLPPVSPQNDRIEKFPFASDSSASDIGELLCKTDQGSGQSSTASGYISGGQFEPGGTTNTISKFPFASDTPASDVGNLTSIKYGTAGQSF